MFGSGQLKGAIREILPKLGEYYGTVPLPAVSSDAAILTTMGGVKPPEGGKPMYWANALIVAETLEKASELRERLRRVLSDTS